MVYEVVTLMVGSEGVTVSYLKLNALTMGASKIATVMIIKVCSCFIFEVLSIFNIIDINIEFISMMRFDF
jgi:hypothetical protein